MGLAIVLAAVWVVITGLMARSQSYALQRDLRELKMQINQGDTAGASQTARTIAQRAHRAHDLTTGPAWWAVSHLPAGGEPFRTARAVATAIDRMGAEVVPVVVSTSEQLDPASLRLPGSRLDVDRIAAAAPALDAVDTELQRTITDVRAQTGHTWLGTVDDARSTLLEKLASLGGTVHSARVAADIAPDLLGRNTPQRYFVAFQNDAEARGTGGLPGTFAILKADRGRLSFERFEPDRTLGTTPTGLNLGKDYDSLYAGGRSTSLFINSNLSPHFPYAARIWIAMWAKHSGEQLDGAMVIDPTALSDLLRVSGPVPLPDGTKVRPNNVVALTQSKLYNRYPRAAQAKARQQFLIRIARAVSERLLRGDLDTKKLLKAGGDAVAQRRLLVYSTTPSIEAELARTALGGVVPETSQPYVGLTLVNVAGNKLDYYLERSLVWRRTGCGPVRDVTATVRLTNTAPASGLPPYVTVRNDFPSHPTRPGDNRQAVYYFATQGAALRSVTIDGKPTTPSVGVQRGHPAFVADVEIPRGTSRTIVFTMREPAGTDAPIVLQQPLVNPLRLKIADATCP